MAREAETLAGERENDDRGRNIGEKGSNTGEGEREKRSEAEILAM